MYLDSCAFLLNRKNMTLFVALLLVLQVRGGLGGRGPGALLPFLPTEEGVHVSDAISRRLGLDGISASAPASRHPPPPSLMSLLSLLWPQVVGPIDNGVIKEESFESVPQTVLEKQLEQIRSKSRGEVETRQHIRHMLNTGVDPASIGFHHLHLLHPDMAAFIPTHPFSNPQFGHDAPYYPLFPQQHPPVPVLHSFGGVPPLHGDPHPILHPAQYFPQEASLHDWPFHALFPNGFNFPPKPIEAKSNSTSSKQSGPKEVEEQVKSDASEVKGGVEDVRYRLAQLQDMLPVQASLGLPLGPWPLLNMPPPAQPSARSDEDRPHHRESLYDAFGGTLPNFPL